MSTKIRQVNFAVKNLLDKKRVAAYARVSSDKDEMLHSLSAQVSYYNDFIQRRKEWQHAGVYADEAITGTKDSRPEFQKLLAECRNRKVDMIITKSVSRFARNTVILLEVIRELKALNVDVYFQQDNIHSISGEGEFMLTLLASFAQAESLSVSENCKWRIRKGFEIGELINLRFMYGYRIKNGKIEIHEDEANIVRMIFEDYISGIGSIKIAKKLRENRVDKLRGGIWSSERVIEIIKNEKYTGNALLQKKYVKDHLTKSLVRNKGDLPQYYAEETHPPIIDLDTFKKAQVIMNKNREKYSGKKGVFKYPFTSKIVCCICGKKYKHKNKQGHVSWNCSTYLKYGKKSCPTKQIPEDILILITTEVLGVKEFDESVFEKVIKEIQVPEHNVLTFILNDGTTIKREWNYALRNYQN